MVKPVATMTGIGMRLGMIVLAAAFVVAAPSVAAGFKGPDLKQLPIYVPSDIDDAIDVNEKYEQPIDKVGGHVDRCTTSRQIERDDVAILIPFPSAKSCLNKHWSVGSVTSYHTTG